MYKPVIIKKEINDEHFYYVDGKFTPGVTTILDESMPMPFGLRKWIGDVGNEKAEQKLNAAGDRGSAIHKACEALLLGETIKLQENFPQERDQKCIVSFINWINLFQPDLGKTNEDIYKNIEQVVASSLGFAGTLDLCCQIDPDLIFKHTKFRTDNPNWIIDLKTSRDIYDSHKLQITGYKEAKFEMTGIQYNRGILLLNPLTIIGYKFMTENKMTIAGKPVTTEDFMTVFNMYLMLNGGKVKEPNLENVYPESLSLYEDGDQRKQLQNVVPLNKPTVKPETINLG